MAESALHVTRKWLTLRVSDEMRELIQLGAKRQNIGSSEWVRAACAEKLERDGIKKPKPKGWRRYGSPSTPGSDGKGSDHPK